MRIDVILATFVLMSGLGIAGQSAALSNSSYLDPILKPVEASISLGRDRERRFDFSGALGAYESAMKPLEEWPPIRTGLTPLFGSPANSYATCALLRSTLELDIARVKTLRGDPFTSCEDDLLLSEATALTILGIPVTAPPSPFIHTLPKMWNETPTPAHMLYASLNLARTHMMRGEFEQAADYYSRALKIDPTNQDAMNGWTYARTQVSARHGSLPSIGSHQYQLMVDAAISIGTTFLTKEYPVGAPVVGKILSLINNLYPDYQRPK